MQNDMLKNNIAPWQEKGRWYHMEIESDNSAWSINYNHSDKLFSNKTFTSATVLHVIEKPIDGKCIVDYKAIFRGTVNSGTNIQRPNNSFYLFEITTRTYLYLPTATTFNGAIDLYFFIV